MNKCEVRAFSSIDIVADFRSFLKCQWYLLPGGGPRVPQLNYKVKMRLRKGEKIGFRDELGQV